ncbi:MAG: cytochrome P450 [Pseudomonadales bacterium]|nr:cytochrome P450 [Pseudomonadales bacterium]MCP5183151.1 cytochrome P450 [Pseudomonadales bacterium]
MPASENAFLRRFSLFDDTTRECPFPYFAAIRREAPVYFMPELGAYYVSRYEDVRYVKKHPELFSNDIYTHGVTRGSTRNIAEEYRCEHGWARVSTLQRTDPPVHGKYRRLINDAFTVARVRRMTDYIETVVNDLVDAFIDTGHCDFMQAFSIPLPCTVIADQLGVPRERIPDLKQWSDAMLAPGGGFVSESEALECGRLVVEAQHFFAQVIADRRTEPRDDIITSLVQAEVRDTPEAPPRPLDMYELMDLLDQLLTGGNETTTNAIGSAMMLVLQAPGMMAELRDNPPLIRNFIEEALRFETPVLHLWRAATQDTEIGGVAIPKGSSIALGYASANRDEAVFDSPETFDPARRKAGAHLAFGSGPHHCPGSALARQEIFSAFNILLHRLDNIRLADPNDSFAHVPSSFLRGLAHLNIRFDCRQRSRYTPGLSAY